ncbi:uncharacterized protein EHS24_002727 [Apiotrichum porosum]|uniref:Ubiquitin-like domain-containing protein n=1 Tax=Apiotrichum porosum TaxID=105984 RepID=A0A427XHF8_9TREE|nr:uncharacterized protein EHS24_002727 [Apiotrichum porosum]RSH78262.1 hypothetical protein EHS24_002727 [Apiotrichum porosum]
MSQTATSTPVAAASSAPAPPAAPAPEPTPMVHVRVLIISGQNHTFSFEPETTVGRMKELIWSMWPSEWTSPAQPPNPSWLRVLYAGRVLSDDSTLTSNNLPASMTASLPTVIHLSVRSFSIRGEDDAKKGLHRISTRTSTHRNQHSEEDVGGCSCVIM